MREDRGPLAGMDDVPWHRIVHFYGRASDVPPAIRRLAGSERAGAIRHLRGCLEHQDGVIQATPLAVRFILRMRDGDPDGVRAIIERVAAAARSMLRNATGPLPEVSWEASLTEGRLWPPFTTAWDDECRWEEWNPPTEEWVGWAALTLREIATAEASTT